MADAINVVTRKEYRNGTKIVTVNMTCATAAAAFNSEQFEERGKRLHSITIVPGATGPTDNSDLSLTDGVSGVDMLVTNGANAVDNATTNKIDPDDTTNVIIGPLTMAITNNSVNNANVVITLVFTTQI